MPSRDPAARYRDILSYIDAAQSDTDGMEFAAFLASPTVQRSVIYCLQCISEAAVKLGYHAEEHAPEADWRNIRGFGNISRHDYGEIDLTLVWSILRDGLPGLKRSCERVLGA